jgi:hypothetical protein
MRVLTVLLVSLGMVLCFCSNVIAEDNTTAVSPPPAEQPAPVVTPRPAHSPVAIGIGALCGVGTGTATEAISGYEKTKVDQKIITGGSLFIGTNKGIGAELLVEHYDMVLKENSDEFCTITMMPILIGVQGQSMPANSGFAFHGGLGLGMSVNKIEKGPFFKNLENYYGVPGAIDLTIDNSFVFEFDAGVDYFFIRNLALNVDFKWLIGNVSADWNIYGQSMNDAASLDTIHISNVQALIGLKYWFR